MNRYYGMIFYLFLGFSSQVIFAQIEPRSNPIKDGKESLWKGFKRYDFKYNTKEARLIVPTNPLPSSPWIWRARFPGWHTEADSILVSEGFHLAYINTNKQFGSPKAMKIWDDFYNFLTTELKLHEKVSLVGVSRGGLFIYNWAKRNPNKVACIYAEAPVCDLKSWPAGFGKSDGNKKEWETLKKEYGFASDKEAKSYTNNPIDNLEALAAAKIPILHMVGLNDKIVPVNENTLTLIDNYIRLGGIATVVPCTQGKQTQKGHHFTIETPQTVVDFIKYHSLQYLPLEASNYHQERNGIQNSHIKFERYKKGTVAFLGGSITKNRGWRDSICKYLETRFKETKFKFIGAGIPSMGSTPSAFRLERDVLSKGTIDLLFVEAAVNDAINKRSTDEQIRAMEGVVRHTKKANSDVDIIIMHFVDPYKIKSYNKGLEPVVITNHNKIAAHYEIPTINLAKEVTDRINNKEFTWKDDFKNLHPSPFGQGIYANSIIRFLNNSFSSHIDNDDKILSNTLPEKFEQNSYDKGSLIDVSTADRVKGWRIDPMWNPNDGTRTRPNYVNVPMLIGDTPRSTLNLKFEGNTVGIAIASGKDAGTIEYRIDKKEWTTLNLFGNWGKNLHNPRYITLAAGLTKEAHELEIRIADTKDPRSAGNACRIRYFFVNRN